MNTILNLVPSPIRTTSGFVLHFLEMSIAMIVGMLLFMAIPGVMQLPRELHLLGMALAMTLPMIGWMRVRGHPWQHGIEMSLGMLLPWAAVLTLVALGAATVLPWLEQADSPAMFLGMLGVMLLRPQHAHAHHHVHDSGPIGSADPVRNGSRPDERVTHRGVPGADVLLLLSRLSQELSPTPGSHAFSGR